MSFRGDPKTGEWEGAVEECISGNTFSHGEVVEPFWTYIGPRVQTPLSRPSLSEIKSSTLWDLLRKPQNPRGVVRVTPNTIVEKGSLEYSNTNSIYKFLSTTPQGTPITCVNLYLVYVLPHSPLQITLRSPGPQVSH